MVGVCGGEAVVEVSVLACVLATKTHSQQQALDKDTLLSNRP